MGDDDRQQVIDQIIERISASSVVEMEALKAFARHYYGFVMVDELLQRGVDDLYGALLSHWHLLQHRPVHHPKLRLYNPTLEGDGWQSSHTVVDIVVEDMPFLVQSIAMGLNRFGLTNHLIIHPTLVVTRSGKGDLLPDGSVTPKAYSVKEVLIHVECDRLSHPERLAELARTLEFTLADVAAATDDWPQSLQRLEAVVAELATMAHGQREASIEEAIAFLRWLQAGHFIFLGYRDYRLCGDSGTEGLQIIEESGLGILRDALTHRSYHDTPPLGARAMALLKDPTPLMITKATTRATVHRPVFMDYIGVKQYDSGGEVVGEHRFLGLYTSAAYHHPVDTIPLLRQKLLYVTQESPFALEGHNSRALMHILEEMPRDELFHASGAELLHYAMGVLHLQERQQIRLFVRHDLYGCFYSVVVFVPREQFTTETRLKVQQLLMEESRGEGVDFKVQLSESLLARLHFIIHTSSDSPDRLDCASIEQRIVELFMDWRSELGQVLRQHHGEEQGNRLFTRYGRGFSAAYRDDFRPRSAVADLDRIETLDPQGDGVAILLYHPPEADEHQLRCKIMRAGRAVPLSSTLPMLENMGVRVEDEHPYEVVNAEDGIRYWIHDYGFSFTKAGGLDFITLQPRFEETLQQIWQGRCDNDGFNQLVLRAGMRWREVMVVRALYLYLKQIGTSFSQSYIEQSIANHPQVAQLLVRLFQTRFEPLLEERDIRYAHLTESILEAIEQVRSLDEDRILRSFLELIRATVRTNYYQQRTDELGSPYLAIKLNPAKITLMPEPRPQHEIFVYSVRVEGVHLRGGGVARGGLRWSDRREDYRTEVLGLMKAQISKNAVIVPTGSKGGFVVKSNLEGRSREQQQQEVVCCYRIFVQGLLDLTDNLVGSETRKPELAVCHDGDDPYLVVAADKGTATFSDIANGVAAEYGFWLGDAFASGGSAGYDHKQMGITARGAWECVKRHFRELGTDIQSQPFSVVGIGGMSGDVFGNGMLLSPQIRLVAAFNHHQIFLDPNPDAAVSLQERHRLFVLPRSSWADYKPELISKGGGVFLRSAKSIPLSVEVQTLLAVDHHELPPSELIKALLKAPVDLLWNGGIGTYVKADSERHLDVGDRANDAVRINGCELRCKVVGEGGNLGFTQRGRIEYAAAGGRINTDSVDNSAGVDCSDHEVNIKILLNRPIFAGDMTLKQRDELLEQMTDEVAQLVLRNNYLQSCLISQIEYHAAARIDADQRLLRVLAEEGPLVRELEYLPNDEELTRRKASGEGLYRPEIAVLVAYSKLVLKKRLQAGLKHIDSGYQQQQLLDYFPQALGSQPTEVMLGHRLGHEIVINQLVNALVNRMGITFPFRLMDETGASVMDMMRNFRLAVDIFAIEGLWSQVEGLDGQIPWEAQVTMLTEINRLLERTMFWLQRAHPATVSFEESLELFRHGVDGLRQGMSRLLPGKERQQVRQYASQLRRRGVSKPLAHEIALLGALFSTLDPILVANDHQRPLPEVAQLYFLLDETLGLSWLRHQIGELQHSNLWQSLARSAARDDFHAACRGLLQDLLSDNVIHDKRTSVTHRFEQWQHKNGVAIQRYQTLKQRIEISGGISLDKIVVVLKELQRIVRATCQV